MPGAKQAMLVRAQALAPEMIRLRRDIHRHPELGFQEVRTAALVADTLREIGGMEVRYRRRANRRHGHAEQWRAGRRLRCGRTWTRCRFWSKTM